MKMILIFLLSLCMVGCYSQNLKAPCNENASFCGSKTKINIW